MPRGFLLVSLLATSMVWSACGQFDGDGGECEAPCQRPKRAAPKPLFRPWSNGCSVPPFIQMPDFAFEKCCDLHDTCYMTCGVSKAFCEKEFEKCLIGHCKRSYKGNAECKSTASTFVMGVEMFGCTGYQESQQEACDCLSDGAKTVERFAEYTSSFYAAYNSTHALPAETAQKFSGKEGQLVYALYKKYPQAIEIISRDGQATRGKQTLFADPGTTREL